MNVYVILSQTIQAAVNGSVSIIHMIQEYGDDTCVNKLAKLDLIPLLSTIDQFIAKRRPRDVEEKKLLEYIQKSVEKLQIQLNELQKELIIHKGRWFHAYRTPHTDVYTNKIIIYETQLRKRWKLYLQMYPSSVGGGTRGLGNSMNYMGDEGYYAPDNFFGRTSFV